VNLGTDEGQRAVIGSDRRFFVGVQDSKFASYYGDGTEWGISAPHPASQTIRRSYWLFTTVNGDGMVLPYVNGRFLGSRANPFGGASDYFLGKCSGADFWRGFLNEVVVFDTALPALYRAAIENYLVTQHYPFWDTVSASWPAGGTGVRNTSQFFIPNVIQNISASEVNCSVAYRHGALGAIAPAAVRAPDGSLVTPDSYARNVWWDASRWSMGATTSCLSFDIRGARRDIANADRLVILRRTNESSPWTPVDTIRVGHTYAILQTGNYEQYTIGSAAADNPGLETWSDVRDWSLY
jgi:hypothetical protein